MESASSSPPAADEQPRVKFLCSFGGSILPRPLDGRLRYVGGETRIVSVPRDVSFEDLMARMRELFEGAAVIKYQQPDEDLDALVSVVNDDDVMNMMEEYDKLGSSGDGLVRLRIFLFSQQQTEIDAATTVSHFDTNERETERRYVDALNSLTDTKPQPPPDATEQFFWPPGIDGGVHTHLHHLNIPHPSRYGDMETSWSPVYYSPGHHTPHDPREFPSSPPSARYQIGVGELSDRIPEEYVMQSPGYQPQQYDHQSPSYVENVVWLPPGAIIQEKAGFPGNLAHSHNVVEGSNICKNCLMAFQTQSTVPDARYLDPRWKHGQPHMEQFSSGNEYMVQFSKSCAERYRGHEAYMLTQECYNDSHLLHQHQLNHRLEDLRLPASGNVRASEHYVVDANGMKLPYAQSHACDVRSLPSSSINPDGTRYLRPANETGNEVLHAQQTVGGAPHAHIPGVEDTGAQYVNYPSAYGLDNLYPLQHNLPPVQPLWRNPQAPMHPGPPYEPGLMIPNGKSPRYTGLGVDEQNQSPWAAHNGSMPQRISGPDGSSAPENLCKMNLGIVVQDVQRPAAPSSTQCQPVVMHVEVPGDAVLLAPPSSFLNNDRVVASPGDHQSPTLGIERVVEDATKEAHANSNPSPKKEEILEFDKEGLRPTEEGSPVAKVADSDAGVTVQHRNISAECLSFLPELIASVKKAVLEGAEEVKARAEANADAENPHVAEKKESSVPELEPGNTDAEVDADSDNEHPPKIEPTVAEADALARGLQTIKNADLEEIRELGSGTYGAVYHGKWKGSDVAIKRIKASCFAGRPSERERLIADFWKEALILSSLHHPNVVSFYGVVRDGPDGSLATVTEFMVNGSLKQFLQKKDRTIDRRKRLILAMDAAFGMEYLHGKNIVHFDLKCENLLVNMRDPHRPICKIGDLGLSKVKQHTLVSGGVRGTLPWMAPELLNGKSNMVTEKIDVYSFGIVMWELLTGEEPYADMRCASIIGGIVNDSLRPQIPTWCDPEWKSLMESCWSGDPGKRPSFTEISQKLRKMSAAMNVK